MQIVAFLESWWWFVIVRAIWLAVSLYFDAWWAVWMVIGEIPSSLVLRRRDRQLEDIVAENARLHSRVHGLCARGKQLQAELREAVRRDSEQRAQSKPFDVNAAYLRPSGPR